MQRLKVLGLALMAVLMLGVVASASASAEEVLPKLSVETGGTGKFGASKLNLTGANILSPGGIISKFTTNPGGRSGTFDILFENSSLLGETCLRLPDATGIILVPGTWQLVHRPGAPTHVFLLLTVKEIHIECPGLGLLVLILEKSTILALILPFGKLTKEFKLSVNTLEEGKKQEFNEWVDDAGKVHKTELLGALNGGKDK